MIIGLTGAMGAGKTTTAELMKELGWTVFDADAEVHALMTDKAVVALFSEKSLKAWLTALSTVPF